MFEWGKKDALKRCTQIYAEVNDDFKNIKGIAYNLECCLKNKYSECVIVSEGEDIGFIVGNIFFWDEEKYVKIDEICIKTDFQKKGYGSILLKEFEEKMRLKGVKTIYFEHYVDEGLDKFYSQNEYIIATDKRMRYKVF